MTLRDAEINRMIDGPAGSAQRDSSSYSLPPKRRRTVWLWPCLILILSLGLVPYSSQVFPAMALQIVDSHGKGIGDIGIAQWRGSSNAGRIEGSAQFDDEGRIALTPQRVRACFYYRGLANSGLLHKLRLPTGSLTFRLLTGRLLDTDGMQRAPYNATVWSLTSEEVRQSTDADGREVIALSFSDPERNRATPFKLIVRETSALSLQ